MSLKIRAESPADAPAIEQLTIAAFEHAPHTNGAEHFIVNALRRAGQLSISLVAQDDDEIAGHVALSPVSLSDGTTGWYGLGPISVLPGHQGRRIGSHLMEAALAELQRLGCKRLRGSRRPCLLRALRLRCHASPGAAGCTP